MIESTGDIWEWHAKKYWVVVPTNIGWKKDGSNPMGMGVALKAATIYPDLAMWYGKRCQKYAASLAVCAYKYGSLILFPTKPLDPVKPWLSWKSQSTIELIRRSTIELRFLADVLFTRKLCSDVIVLPLVGCGAGGFSRNQVVPVLKEHLDDRFVLIEQN